MNIQLHSMSSKYIPKMYMYMLSLKLTLTGLYTSTMALNETSLSNLLFEKLGVAEC